jgi:hypothetical protein
MSLSNEIKVQRSYFLLGDSNFFFIQLFIQFFLALLLTFGLFIILSIQLLEGKKKKKVNKEANKKKIHSFLSLQLILILILLSLHHSPSVNSSLFIFSDAFDLI